MAVMPLEQESNEVLPGFEHIVRVWNETHGMNAARLQPGEFYVTGKDEVITTVLGSCVAACIRDPNRGVGGMNHFMLPGGHDSVDDTLWGGVETLLTRYGVAAMESLINEMLKLGATRSCLEVKLFGGGSIFDAGLANVGERNVQFVREFVKTEKLNVVAEDLGGTLPRKINYFPRTGRVMLKRLRMAQSAAVLEGEKLYESRIGKTEQGGQVFLFD
ncbi:MAG: chemoreceptor glutamine deamidase CheD [Woeseia sp.]